MNIKYDFTAITGVIEAIRFIDSIDPDTVEMDQLLVAPVVTPDLTKIRNSQYRVNHWFLSLDMFSKNHQREIEHNEPIRLVHQTKIVLNGASMSRVINLLSEDNRFEYECCARRNEEYYACGYSYRDIINFMSNNASVKQNSKFQVTFYWSFVHNKILWSFSVLGDTARYKQRNGDRSFVRMSDGKRHRPRHY